MTETRAEYVAGDRLSDELERLRFVRDSARRACLEWKAAHPTADEFPDMPDTVGWVLDELYRLRADETELLTEIDALKLKLGILDGELRTARQVNAAMLGKIAVLEERDGWRRAEMDRNG